MAQPYSRLGFTSYNGRLLTEAQRARVEVVLVAPRNPLNVGAASRAMANFGFSQLTVVAPYAPHWAEAKQSAVGASSVLDHAREAATLAEAIAQCTLVLGTGTLTYRKAEQPVVALPDAGSLVISELQRGGHVAIVFGPEKRGLARDDLALCHRLLVIPTDARQPSMNLGQAVAVCLYEIGARPAKIAEAMQGSPGRIDFAPQPTNSGNLDRMASLIEEVMREAGYSPNAMQKANHHDLQLMLRRLELDQKDARRILGLFRRVLTHMKRPSTKK
ncbi:MAG TPA: TrmH family RNA methyltransferase [Terracidiphilus sp.]|nr:TrmH family RNA methyltransferase [Terracidiphilus sp.]